MVLSENSQWGNNGEQLSHSLELDAFPRLIRLLLSPITMTLPDALLTGFSGALCLAIFSGYDESKPR